jgi:hypothetical protein
MGCASGLNLEPHTYIYLYIDSGKKNIFSSFVFTLRSQLAPPGIIHYRVRGTRYRVTGTGTGTGETTSPAGMSSPDLQPSEIYNRVMFLYKMSTGVII